MSKWIISCGKTNELTDYKPILILRHCYSILRSVVVLQDLHFVSRYSGEIQRIVERFEEHRAGGIVTVDNRVNSIRNFILQHIDYSQHLFSICFNS